MKMESRRMRAVLAMAVAGLVAGASGQAWGAATTGFSQAAGGPYDYNTSGNWVNGTINGAWDSSLALTAAQTVTFAADTALTTGLTFNYTGGFNETLQATGANHLLTLGGDISVNAAGTPTVTIGSSTANANLNVDLGGVTRTLNVSAGKTLTFANVVSDGGITATGGGTVSLLGTNTFTGVLTANGGTTLSYNLYGSSITGGTPSVLGAASAAAGNIVLDNGTLLMANLNDTVNHLFTIGLGGATIQGYQGSFSNTGALAFSGTGSHVLNLRNNYSVLSFSPQINDAGTGQPTSLVIGNAANASQVNLYGASSYSGGTTINAGVLAAAAPNATSLGTGGVTVNAGCTLEVTGTANLNTGGGAKVQLNGTPTNYAMFNAGFDATQAWLSSAISTSSTYGILSIFDGLNTNPYSGSTAQALDLGSLGDGKLFLSGAGMANNGGYNEFVTYTASTLGVGAGNTYRLGGGYSNGPRILTIKNDVLANATNSLQNNLVIAPAGMASSAQTVQFLSANSAFTGTTTLNSGTLALSGAGALGGSDITANASPSGTAIPTTVYFDSSTNGVTGTTRAKSVTLNGAYLSVTGSATVSSTDTITNALTISAGANTGAGMGMDYITVTPNGAKNALLAVGSLSTANGGVALFRGTSLGQNTIASATAGAANISVGTAPTMIGGGGAAGTTNISIIPWALGDISASGTGVGTNDGFVTYDSANGIRPLNTSTEYVATLSSLNGTVSSSNVRITAADSISANTTVNSLFLNTGGVTVSGTSTLTVTSGEIFSNQSNGTTISPNINFGSAHGYIGKNNSGFNLSMNGSISGSNGVTVFSNAGPLAGSTAVGFFGNNTYTGDTIIVGGLRTNGLNAIPNGPGKGNVYLYGTLDAYYSGGIVGPVMNGLYGSGTLSNSGFSGGSFTVGNNNATSEFDGVITNGVNFNKIGSGTLTLTGSNTYTLTTTISGGTLVAALASNGTPLGTGPVVMSGNSTLSVAPGSAVSQTLASAAGTTPSTFLFNDSDILSVSNGATVTIGGNTDGSTKNLVRGTASGGPGGILGIVANSGMANLGGSGEKVIVAGASGNQPTVTGGIVAPYILGLDATSGAASFLTYGSTGFVLPAYTAHSSGTLTPAGEVSDITGPTTFSGGSASAVRVAAGQTLTIASGTSLSLGAGSQAGIILNGGSITGGSIAIGSAEAIVYAAAGTTGTIGSPITGTGSLTTAGPGTLILAASSTYAGSTALNNGTLKAGVDNALPVTTSVTVIGGTFDLNGHNQTLAGLATGAVSTGAITNSTGSGVLTLNVASNSTFSGAITGSLALTKAGTSTLTLTGSDTYSGATTVNAGGLTLAGATGSAANSAITADSGTTVTFDSTTSGVAGATRSASLTLTSANLNVKGNNTANSVDTITGALTIGSSSANGTAPGIVVVTLTPNAAKNTQLAVGSLATNFSEVLFRGTNLGQNTIASATAGAANITVATAPTLVGGGGAAGSTNISIIPWALGDISATGNGVGTNDGFITYDSANGIRPLNTTTEYATSLSALSGTVSTNNVRMAANDSISADTTINSLYLTTSNITLSGTKTLTVTSGAIFANMDNGHDAVISPNINLGSAHGYIGKSTQAYLLKLNGVISGSNGVTFYNNGAPTSRSNAILLGANNTYTGDTYIQGAVKDGAANGIPNGAGYGNVYDNGLLDVAAGSCSINGLFGNGVVSSYDGNDTLFVGNNNTSSTFGGTFLDQGSNNFAKLYVTKVGTGTLTLTGTNTAYGTTTVTAGILQIGNGGTTGAVSNGSYVTNASLVFNRSDTLTVSNAISGTGSVTHAGTGTLVLTGTNSYSGGTTVTTGTLQGNSSSLQGNITNNGTVIFDQTTTGAYSGVISGSGSLTKQNSGTVALSGLQTYTGPTVIKGGTLKLSPSYSLTTNTFTSDANSGIGSSGYTEALAFNQGANLTINGQTFTNTGNATTGTGSSGTSWSVSGIPSSGVSGSFPSGFTLGSSNATYSLLNHFYYGAGNGSVETITITGLTAGQSYDARLYYRAWSTIDTRTAALTFSGGAVPLTLGSVNEDGDANAHYIDYTYTASSNGTLTVSINPPTANSWHVYGFTNQAIATPATVNNGLPTTTPLTIQSGATFDLNGGNQQVASLGDVAGSGGGSVINNGSATSVLTLSPASGSTTFSGTIQDGTAKLALTKSGGGTQILTGANTYTGGTTVSGGELDVTVTSLPANSPVSVTGGGKLVVAKDTPHSLVTLSRLTGSTGGTLNLANHDLLIPGGLANGATLASYLGLVTTQTTVDGAPNAPTAIALVSGKDYKALGGPSTLADTDLYGKFTFKGDANLDGKITADDYLALDVGYLFGLTGWTHGDFEQTTGTITAQDYADIDLSYQYQNGKTAAAGEIALHTQWFGAAYTNAFAALNAPAVPEPASLGLLAVGAVALLRRRK